MFSFKYIINDKLPKLAWLAQVQKTTQEIIVYCGSNVECHDTFFVAGAWDGVFTEARFDVSSVFLGTGAMIKDECVKFCTPSHALERIVSQEDSEYFYISNSVPFLMSFTNTNLDSSIDQYERIFCSILDGPHKQQSEIPLLNGRMMRQYIVGAFIIHRDGNSEYVRREKIEPFVDFKDYYGRMIFAMECLYTNAIAQERLHTKFGLCTTISSGYDSVANAAIAKHLGCNTAVALCGGIFDEDDGSIVAEQMGYTHIVKRHHLSYKEKEGCIDAEYVASGEIAKHEQFAVFEDLFANCIVFMGTRGDYFWGLDTVANDDFEMIGFFFNETDISYTENALKNGYLISPMATYGASASTSIQRISKSDEMIPWRLFTQYDRPIPRRIAESAGAKRESFGQEKRGGGFSFCYDTINTLSNKMSNEGYASFVEYRKKHKAVNRASKYLHAIQFWMSFLPSYINYVFRKLRIDFKLKQAALKVANPFVSSELIFWSIDVMKEKYSAIKRD